MKEIEENGSDSCCDNISFTDEDENGRFDSNGNRFDEIDHPELKNISQLKKKCSVINSNYELLQNRFQQLHIANGGNMETIEKLQAKVKLLEIQLKEEKQLKENMSRKATVLESRVGSLEYQLKEIYDSDFLAKTTENNEKVVASLKQRYQDELNKLTSKFEKEVEDLNQQLTKQEETIFAQNDTISKYKQEISRLKQMPSERELRAKIEKELKQSKEAIEQNLLRSFDQSMLRLKEEWEQKLQEDIEQIILTIENNLNCNDDDVNAFRSVKFNVRFEKLIQLCDSIQSSISKREDRIAKQIVNLDEAKYQLEMALLESKVSSSSNVSCSSDKSQMEEIKAELNQVRGESQMLTQKLQKYKQHYLMLDRRYKEEIEALKRHFVTIIDKLKNH